MRRVNPLPTLMTLCNMFSGLWAITLAMRSIHPEGGALEAADLQTYAAGAVFLAMVFDVLDGRVARLTGMTSRFGAELDSLSDMVSFGLAPAVLANAVFRSSAWAGNVTLGRVSWVLLALYAAGAAVRLARYNVEAISATDGSVGAKGRDYFVGLPSPAAAGLAVSFVLLHHWVSHNAKDLWVEKFMALALPALMALLGWLMVSRVRYVHVGNWFFSGRRKLVPVMLIGAVLALAAALHELIGILVFGIYVLGFLAWDLGRSLAHARARRRLRRAGRAAPPPDARLG